MADSGHIEGVKQLRLDLIHSNMLLECLDFVFSIGISSASERLVVDVGVNEALLVLFVAHLVAHGCGTG